MLYPKYFRNPYDKCESTGHISASVLSGKGPLYPNSRQNSGQQSSHQRFTAWGGVRVEEGTGRITGIKCSAAEGGREGVAGAGAPAPCTARIPGAGVRSHHKMH